VSPALSLNDTVPLLSHTTYATIRFPAVVDLRKRTLTLLPEVTLKARFCTNTGAAVARSTSSACTIVATSTPAATSVTRRIPRGAPSIISPLSSIVPPASVDGRGHPQSGPPLPHVRGD